MLRTPHNLRRNEENLLRLHYKRLFHLMEIDKNLNVRAELWLWDWGIISPILYFASDMHIADYL